MSYSRIIQPCSCCTCTAARTVEVEGKVSARRQTHAHWTALGCPNLGSAGRNEPTTKPSQNSRVQRPQTTAPNRHRLQRQSDTDCSPYRTETTVRVGHRLKSLLDTHYIGYWTDITVPIGHRLQCLSDTSPWCKTITNDFGHYRSELFSFLYSPPLSPAQKRNKILCASLRTQKHPNIHRPTLIN